MHPNAAFTQQLKKFGQNVRRERTARDLTQERLAELADLNLRTIQKIEAGEINLLLTTVLRIQAALKCSWARYPFGENVKIIRRLSTAEFQNIGKH